MKLMLTGIVLSLTIGILMSASPALADFAGERPWLKDRSAWSETIGAKGGMNGWWGVGNSKVFGIVGPDIRHARMHQITGPHIMLANVMNDGSAFCPKNMPTTMHLSIGGKPVEFTKSTLSKVRGTNIVAMDLVASNVTMSVYNYAPFDVNAIMRTVVVTNTSNAPLSDVVLVVKVGRTQLVDGILYNSFKGHAGASATGHTRQMFTSLLEPCQVKAPEDKAGLGTLTAELGTLAPGAEIVRTQYMAFSMKEVGDEAATVAKIKEQKTNLLKKTYDDWKTWLASTTTLKCSDQKFIDLLDDTKILVRIQTAHPQYAAGPMEFFGGVWIRDSNGPFLYYLRMGRLDAAKKMLEFYYRGSASNKHISNFMPMDVDMSKPVDPNLDWTQVRNDPVEIPCWLILQHKWYYNYTGDIEPIKQHWGYLKKCLYGQLTNDKGEPIHYENFGSTEPGANELYRFPHHGDETWIYPGFEVLNSKFFPEPNDHPHWDQYSLDSTWEFVASAEAMARFAKALGNDKEAAEFGKIAVDSRAACERDYWMTEKGFYAPALNMRSLDIHQPPFPMVNFNALWIGYHRGDNPKAISNVIETMKYTMNPNFVTDATETLKVYVGMQPGMFLYNLAAIDHPYAEPALKAMVEVALPSGEYTEKLATQPNSHDPIPCFLGHRIRPWEGGINMDAAFFYLTGLEPDMGHGRVKLCPRLPAKLKTISVTNQKVGDGTLDISVKDTGSNRLYTMNWTGSKALPVDFKVSLPLSQIKSVKVDGKAVKVTPKNKWNMTTAMFEMCLATGKATTVTVEYAAQPTRPLQFKRKRYEYIVPKNVKRYQVVLLDADPRKRNEKDFRTFNYLKQAKVNYRLLSCFNPYNPAWLRPFLLRKDGTINTSVFYMLPGSVRHSLKYGKFWGNPELTRLFTEYMNAGGVIVAHSTGESTSDIFGKLLPKAYFTVPVKGADIVPAGDAGKQVFELLGLPTGETKLKTNKMYVYQNMVVLGRPAAEKFAAAIVARKFGKGAFLSISAEMNYEQRAAMAKKLIAAGVTAKLVEIIGKAEPESTPGGFKDFSKKNAFRDDFKSYKNGSAGLPVWLPLHGQWEMRNGAYHQVLSNSYDFLTTANARIKGDYRLEAKVRFVKGIMEAGFVFNMPSRFSKGSSEMVRFCGHVDLWQGPFSASGVFSLVNTMKSGLTGKDNKVHTIAVNVNNSKRTFDIYVDGKAVKDGQGLKLTNVAPAEGAYIGLVACRGHVAYESVKVTPIQ